MLSFIFLIKRLCFIRLPQFTHSHTHTCTHLACKCILIADDGPIRVLFMPEDPILILCVVIMRSLA